MMSELAKMAQFKPKPLAQIEPKYFLFQIKVAQFEAKSLAQFDRNAWRKSNRSIQLNFKYRIAGIVFGVIHGPEDNWAVCEQATASEMGMTFLDILPKDYSELSYKQLDTI